MSNSLRKTMTRDNVSVLHLARSCCRTRIYHFAIHRYVSGGLQINFMVRDKPSARNRFAEILSGEIAQRSNGRFTTSTARHHLNRLVELGHITSEVHAGWSNRYRLPDAFDDPIFDEAVQFYRDAGLSFDEIRKVDLPAVP